jgi:hypothetical protein
MIIDKPPDRLLSRTEIAEITKCSENTEVCLEFLEGQAQIIKLE